MSCIYLSFSRQCRLMVSHWSLSDSKSPQVSRILLSILAGLNNVVIWIISTRPLISMFSGPYSNPLVTLPWAPITIGITVSFMFHCFFGSLARTWYLSLLLLSFTFTLWSAWTGKSTIRLVLFFCWLSSGLVIWQKINDLYLKIPEKFVRLIFRDGFWVVPIPFVRLVRSKLLA